MKKTTIALLSFLITVFSVQAADRNPIDLVVLLDTSSSMYPSRKEVSDYIVGPLLTEFLKRGDTFHLLSFSSSTKAEISRKIEGPEDIETVIARLLLMYPLDPFTDFISALDEVHQYLRELPESRTKTVVLISDGEHSPKGGSPNALLNAEDTAHRIETSTARLKGNGWNFYFIKVPFSGPKALPKLAVSDEGKAGDRNSSKKAADTAGETAIADKTASGAEKTTPAVSSNASGALNPGTTKVSAQMTDASSGEAGSVSKPAASVDVTEVVSESLASPVVEWSKEDGTKTVGAAIGVVFAEFPADLGRQPRSFTIPVKMRNPSETSMYLEAVSVLIDGTDCIAERSFLTLKPRSDGVVKLRVRLPDSYSPGPARLLVAPVFSGTIRLMPDQSTLSLIIKDAPFSRFFGAAAPYLIFGVGFLLAVALLLFIVFFLKRSFGAPNRAAAQASVRSSGTVSPQDEKQAREDRGTTQHPRTNEAVSRNALPLAPAASRSELSSQANHSDAVQSFSSNRAASERAFSPIPIPLPPSSGASSSDPAAGLSPHGGLPPAIVLPKEPKKKAVIVAAPSYTVKKGNARLMLSLWVQDQNRNIGKRNVHLLKSGTVLSLGGGRSDFLVFLVPIPHRIADVHFDGETCALVPRRPDYFPDIGSSIVEDCIGKDIRVVSDKGYELTLRLERFEDPLIKLNAFLHSIDTVGKA